MKENIVFMGKKMEISRSDSDGSSSGRKQLATSLSDPIAGPDKSSLGNRKNSPKSRGKRMITCGWKGNNTVL